MSSVTLPLQPIRLSATHIEGLRGVLKGGTVIPVERDAFTAARSLPNSHIAAVLGTVGKISLNGILGLDGNRCPTLSWMEYLSDPRILDHLEHSVE